MQTDRRGSPAGFLRSIRDAIVGWLRRRTGNLLPAGDTSFKRNAMQMRSFDVVPLVGVGPVRLGMSRSQVHDALEMPLPDTAREGPPDGGPDAFFESALQVSYDADGRTEFIEVYRDGPLAATYGGVDVFGTRADDLVARVARDGPFDPANPEHGFSFVFPSLELSLWRRCIPEEHGDDCFEDTGGGFETIAVGRRGYFSG